MPEEPKCPRWKDVMELSQMAVGDCRTEVEQHVFQCAECRDLVEAEGAVVDFMKEVERGAKIEAAKLSKGVVKKVMKAIDKVEKEGCDE